MKTNLSLLISGTLGYKSLIDLYNFVNIKWIATDKGSIEIIDYAANKNIPLFIGNPRNGKLSNFVSEYKNDLVLSINYLFLLEKEFIKNVKYPINFHGSLLPKYRGRTPHVWAIINNEIETGVTAHFIDFGCDDGAIILQQKLPILDNDTGFTILEKFYKIYPLLIKRVIKLYETNNITSTKQNHSISTKYAKRSPLDGRINWDWQKDRIRNWVRAQAYPYPGAFTYYNKKKIVIDKVSFSEYGFDNELDNGTILRVKPELIIKTSNGSIKIDLIRSNDINFVKYQKLR